VRALEGTEERQGLEQARWVLLENRWNLSAVEYQRLSTLPRTDQRLCRAYLLETVLADILGRCQGGW
jgi:hypothetical protein